MMDHVEKDDHNRNGGEPDMRYLVKPRGRGFSLRMLTPEVLVGTLNPWTKKPFGREINSIMTKIVT